MKNLMLVFILLISLAGCQKKDSPVTKEVVKQPLQKITVAYTTQPKSSIFNIALAKGFFTEEGLDATPQIFGSGQASLQAVLDKKADFGTAAETQIMFNIMKGEKIYVIANMISSTEDNAIVARNETGIAKLADLKGKRIGFIKGTTSEFFLYLILSSVGLKMEDIKPVYLLPEQIEDALESKKIDAASIWNYPLEKIKQKLGKNGLIFYDRDIYTEFFCVVAQQEYVKKNPDTTKRLLRALIKANQFLINHPDETQALLATETKTDRELIRKVWGAYKFHVNLDQGLVLILEDETRWAMKNKLTDLQVMPNYLDYIHTESLKSIAPSAVKISQ